MAAFDIAADVTPLPSEAIFDKITMSAVEGTPLAIALRDCGNRPVAIVGCRRGRHRANLDADASSFPTCSLNAYAVCAGEARASDGPPELAPWSVEVAYSRCAP
jgi:hypothetical protein